jgi:MFS family permease
MRKMGLIILTPSSFAINIASIMLGYVLKQGGSLTSNQDLGIKVATPIGTFCGQLLFGWLADVYGRKRMYGIGQLFKNQTLTACISVLAFGFEKAKPADHQDAWKIVLTHFFCLVCI